MKYLIALLLLSSTLFAQEEFPYKVIHDFDRATSIVVDEDGRIIYEKYTGWYTSEVKIDLYGIMYVEEETPDFHIPRRVYINKPFYDPNILYYSFIEINKSNGWWLQRIDVTPKKFVYLNNLTKEIVEQTRSEDNISFLLNVWGYE